MVGNGGAGFLEFESSSVSSQQHNFGLVHVSETQFFHP